MYVRAMIRDDIGDMLVVMINILVRNKLTLEECLEVVYDDTHDRKGRMAMHLLRGIMELIILVSIGWLMIRPTYLADIEEAIWNPQKEDSKKILAWG